ncbi:unnamed protein product, partial [Rotaria sp. Silwood2]
GGNGEDYDLHQLSYLTYVFVDPDQSIHVSDRGSHRVMKWMKDAKQGIVVAGDQGAGNSLKHLYYPLGLVVDELENIYICDCNNHRIVR